MLARALLADLERARSSPAPRQRAPVPRLRRAARRVPRGSAARRRRHRPAADQGRRRRADRARRRRRFAALCRAHGALFILNDRPDLRRAAGADGVHVGQDDVPVAAGPRAGRPGPARRALHPQPGADRRCRRADVDYIGVGPVHATPTKPGRPAVGLELVRYAARARAASRSSRSAGSTPSNVEAVASRGRDARRRRAGADRRSRSRRTAARGCARRSCTRGSALGQRSRKRGAATEAGRRRAVRPEAAAIGPEPPSAPRSDSAPLRAAQRGRQGHARAPGSGERPWAVTVSAALAALSGIGNLIAYVAGAKIAGKHR